MDRAVTVLTRRALNRALLARQGLLQRMNAPALDTVERLGGLQAQVPRDPYVALWARLRAFDPAELSALIEERRAVRAGLLRSTLHLVSARDALHLAPLTAPVRARAFWSPFGAGLRGADPEKVIAAGRAALAGTPLTRAQLSAALAPGFPEADPTSLAMLVTQHVALVQVPPRGLWGRSGAPTWALAEEWLGAALEPEPSLDELVLRHLVAFGPATPADVRAWSGVSGLRVAIERLRPQLRTFRDEAGRELLDVPDGRFADPDTPAPPRLLPEYDNALIAHADRSRIAPDPELRPVVSGGRGTVLVDGFVRGYWRAANGELVIERFRTRGGDPPGTREALGAEAERLAAFLAPGDPPRVRFG
jgi:hypothetical protein